MVDDLGRDKEAHVLQLLVSLKGHAHHLAILKNGAAAVAGIDGGIRLHRKKLAGTGVDIGFELDAGNHTDRAGEQLPARGIAVGDHAGTECRKSIEHERRHPGDPRFILQLQYGEVAVMPDGHNPRGVGLWIVVEIDEEQRGIADHMGIGQDPVFRDDKTTARSFSRRPRSPGGVPTEPVILVDDLYDRICYLRLRPNRPVNGKHRQYAEF